MKDKILIPLVLIAVVVVGLFLLNKQSSMKNKQNTDLSAAELCYKKFKEDSAEGSGTYMPNPASVFCQCMGGQLEIEDTPKGQVGMCNINGKKIDEWDYFDQMNPYDNTYSSSPISSEKRKSFCQKNQQSVYCRN